MAADVFEDLLAPANRLERALPGKGLDPAHAGGDTGFGLELEQPDVAGAAHVGAAAQLDREVAHPDDTHDVAILVAEERQRAGLERVVVGHLFGRDRGVLADARVDLFLDRRQVALADRARDG